MLNKQERGCAVNKKPSMLQKGWWTPLRLTYSAILSVGALALTYVSIVNAFDTYEKKVNKPYHYSCFITMNDSINGPIFRKQTAVNREIVYEITKVRIRQDLTMSKRMRMEADSTFMAESTRINKLF